MNSFRRLGPALDRFDVHDLALEGDLDDPWCPEHRARQHEEGKQQQEQQHLAEDERQDHQEGEEQESHDDQPEVVVEVQVTAREVR